MPFNIRKETTRHFYRNCAKLKPRILQCELMNSCSLILRYPYARKICVPDGFCLSPTSFIFPIRRGILHARRFLHLKRNSWHLFSHQAHCFIRHTVLSINIFFFNFQSLNAVCFFPFYGNFSIRVYATYNETE